MQDQPAGASASASAAPDGEPQGTVLGALAQVAASDPGRIAYLDESGAVTYGGLFDAARRGAAWLARHGVRPGDTIALPLEQAPAHARRTMTFLYAAAYAGAVVLPLLPEAPLAARVELIGRFGAHWVLASGVSPVAGAQALDPRGFDPADAALDAQAPARADRGDAPSVYLFTSGTTGAAKVLLLTHRQIFDKALAVARIVGTGATARIMGPAPWPSNVGMRYLQRAHAIGAACVNVPFAETRGELAGQLARFGTTLMYASPWQMRRLMASPAPSRPLPDFTLGLIGAMVSREELRAARAALTSRLHVDYGCSETGPIALLEADEPAGPGCVGRVLPGVEVRIEGPDGTPLPAGGVGDLGFRSPWMCSDYVGNPVATRRHFRGGWFFPGDAGYLDAGGRLYLQGRTQEVINHGGLKIWPEDIEAVLRQHEDVLDAALAGIPDAAAGEVPVAFLAARAGVHGPLPPALGEAALRAFCAARIDAARVPRHFVLVAQIPRNQTGKILRGALIDAYEQARAAARAGAAEARAPGAGTGR
ncbi:MAG TPA: class I adenylate-forming enzyme family protein [Burkholderiales bacterium]